MSGKLSIRYLATADLLRRYRDVFRFAWSQRQAMAPVQRLPHEAEFLPAALALQETPVSPAPRVAMWSIVAFTAIAAVWAGVGTIDVVATASGRIVSQAGSQVIQPVETAAVRAIHVREGQAVRAGDALIDLDARLAQADSTRAGAEVADARLLAARSRALLAALDSGKAPVLPALPDVPVARRGEAEQLLRSQYQEYLARRSRLEAELARIDAEAQTTRETYAAWDDGREHFLVAAPSPTAESVRALLAGPWPARDAVAAYAAAHWDWDRAAQSYLALFAEIAARPPECAVMPDGALHQSSPRRT